MKVLKIDEKIINKDINQPKGVNTDILLDCFIEIINEENDLPYKLIKRECDRGKF